MKKIKSDQSLKSDHILSKTFYVICPNCQSKSIIEDDSKFGNDEIWFKCFSCKFELQISRLKYDLTKIITKFKSGFVQEEDFVTKQRKIFYPTGEIKIFKIF